MTENSLQRKMSIYHNVSETNHKYCSW